MAAPNSSLRLSGAGPVLALRPSCMRRQHCTHLQWHGPSFQQAAAAMGGRSRRMCQATTEEGLAQQEGQQAANPVPASTLPNQPSQPNAQAETMSVEEIQQRAALLRQQKADAKGSGGIMEGVLEEVQLIKWPSPGKAVLNTVLVIGIVAGTAALLLAINTVLTEVSYVIY